MAGEGAQEIPGLLMQLSGTGLGLWAGGHSEASLVEWDSVVKLPKERGGVGRRKGESRKV